MIHWKEFERMELWPNFKVLAGNLPGGSGEIMKGSVRIAGLWAEI
jgi:hypothetical protein